MLILANTLGIIGDILVIAAFFLLQTKRISSHDLIYSVLNFVGSFGVLFSLVYSWNLPSFFIECSWVVISAWGMYQYFRERKGLN